MLVAESLKQRFCDLINERTAIGVERYGEPLQTDNGRDAERDLTEELLDALQYQEQSRLELKADRDRLAEENAELRHKMAVIAAYNWDLEAYI